MERVDVSSLATRVSLLISGAWAERIIRAWIPAEQGAGMRVNLSFLWEILGFLAGAVRPDNFEGHFYDRQIR